MTQWQTVALGAVAGLTIYLGLPVARLRQRNPGPQSLLNALALGVLLFLIWDILSKALEPIEAAMKDGMKAGHWGPFGLLAAMLVIGLVVGRRFHAPIWGAWGIAAGFLIAYGTDLILTAGGV
jgi:zinc transporter, ZIP family